MGGYCECDKNGSIKGAVITVFDTEINRLFVWYGKSGEVVVYDQWRQEKGRFDMTMPAGWEYADEINPILMAAVNRYVAEFKQNPPDRKSLAWWENSYWRGK